MSDKLFICFAMELLPWFGWVVRGRAAGADVTYDLVMIAVAWVCIVAHVAILGRGRRPT